MAARGALIALVCSAAIAARAHAEAPAGTAPPSAAAVTILAGIRIEADPGLPVDDLRAALPVRVGEPVDPGDLARTRKLLEALPNVRHAHVDLEPGESGEVLVIQLERQPLVRTIGFHGIFPVFEREALKVLRMRAGDSYAPELLEADGARVAELMAKSGLLGSKCVSRAEVVEGDVDVVHDCERGSLASVGAITVIGAQALGEEEIADTLTPWYRLYSGDALAKRVEKLVQRYRELGYVRARVTAVPGQPDADGRVPIAVAVDEGKKLVVEIEGASAVDPDDLREALPFAREGGYGFFLVEEGADAVRKLYEEELRPKTVVTKERAETDAEVSVRYKIQEGAELPLREVRFEGNVAIPSEWLEDAVSSGRRRWLVLSPRWETELTDEDRAAIADYYRASGYADAAVDVPRMEVEEDGVVAVFPLKEGPLYHVGDITIEGSRPDIADVVAAQIALEPGMVYRESDAHAAAESLGRELNTLGYIAARVESETELDPAQALAALDFTIEPGPLFRVTGLVPVGAVETKQSVIEDTFALQPNALLTPDGLAETQKNLRALEVFDAIQVAALGLDDVTPSDVDEEPVDVPIKVQLRERPRIELDVGFGYDTDRGASGRFSLADVNLFDRAKKLSINGTYGERDRSGTAVLSDPRLLGSKWKGAVTGAYQERDLEAFDQRTIRAAASVSRPLAWDLTFAFEAAYELTDTTQVVSEDPDAPEAGLARELVFRPSLAYDTRDDLLYPTRGNFASVSTGISTKTLLSDDNFVVYDLQARHYQTLVEGVVGVVSARFTDVDLYGGTTQVPTPELLFTGGTSTVRGFEEDRIGPLDERNKPLGGGARVIANAELRFPLFWLLEGAVFTDAAVISRDLVDVGFGTAQVGAGGGLRLRSPVGPLRLDVGYPVVNEPASRAVRLHFSFGYPF